MKSKKNMGGLVSFCKPADDAHEKKTSKLWDKYEKNRLIYVYQSDSGIRLVGIKTVGLWVYCYVESCIVDDLEKDFLPRAHANNFIYEPFVIIQPTVSDPSVYKFIDVDVWYSQITWIPFIPKQARESANANVQQKAEKIKAEILQVFQKIPVFRSLNNAKVF